MWLYRINGRFKIFFLKLDKTLYQSHGVVEKHVVINHWRIDKQRLF